jgi:hypothetical protein
VQSGIIQSKEGKHVSDLTFTGPCQRGDKGKAVRLIQEWLCLHGYFVKIDWDFGPATKAAVSQFQNKHQLPPNGIVRKTTFEALIGPMRAALEPIAPEGQSLGRLIAAYARQHVRQHPREIGGRNRGPWVRLYMNGREGPEWPWCAGFVSTLVRQACETLNAPLPITPSVSCDSLAYSATGRDIFITETAAADRGRITAGSLFLCRRTPTDWTHTGIVLRAEADYFLTAEGNTNDDGSPEGYEACLRTRGYKAKDFIVIE